MILFKTQFKVNIFKANLYEPAHEGLVLITKATSEGSGEPAHPRSLARVIDVRMKYGSRRSQTPSPLDGSHARLKNEFTEDGKCHNLMIWLI